MEFHVPASCPFTVSKIQFEHSTHSSTWLIREHDEYGEYPHIYAKLCESPSSSAEDEKAQVIVLSDTGCGTEVPNPEHHRNKCSDLLTQRPQPEVWNIRTFLEYTLNQGGLIPYLVMTTHCHYDHIMGIGKLPPTSPSSNEYPPTPKLTINNDAQERPPPTQVLSSCHAPSFITPYPHLQTHSLCSTINLAAPHYTISIWAHDFQHITYTYASPSTSPSPPHTSTPIPTSLTTIHTPGHTPDSLSWYDSDHQLLCVGDSFYAKSSPETQSAPWGPEPPAPTIFDLESDLSTWWASLDKILRFVQRRNEELKKPHQDHQLHQSHQSHQDHQTQRSYIDSNDPPHLSTVHDEKATQTGFTHDPALNHVTPTVETASDDQDWLLVNISPLRVRLCAAHTTLSLDAEHACLEMKAFIKALLSNEVPSKRVSNGPRGEERWLWDYALNEGREEGGFSVLAPLSVIGKGKMKIWNELSY